MSLALILIALLVILVTIAIAYVRNIIKLYHFLAARQIPLFGRHYRNPIEIYSDFSLLSRLFENSGEIESLDREVSERVLTIRRLFLLQLVLGGIIFVGFMVNAMMHG